MSGAQSQSHISLGTSNISAPLQGLRSIRSLGTYGGFAAGSIFGFAAATGLGLWIVPAEGTIFGWWTEGLVGAACFATILALCGLLAIARSREQRARHRVAVLQDAFDSLGDGVGIYDADDRFVICNRQFRKIRNKNPLSCQPGAHFGDILRSGIAVGEIPHPPEGVDAWVERRLAERRKPFGSYVQKRGDRWLRLTDRRTQQGWLVTIHADITDLKTVELDLQASKAEAEAARARMADWAEAANDWFWETDADGRFTFVSDGIEKAMGVNPCDLIGKRIDANRTEADSEKWTAHLQVLAKREPFRNSIVDRPAKDKVRYISVSGKPIYDNEGKFIGYRGTSSNVTAQVEYQRKLTNQTEILASLIENLPLAVSLVGPDLRYLAFNSEFLSGLGLSPCDLRPGDPFEKFVRLLAAKGDYGPGDVDTLVRKRMSRIVSHPEPDRFEVAQSSGRVIDVRVLPLAGGGFVTTRIDVTEERLRQAELQFAHRELERQTEILATLIKHLPVGTIFVGADLRFRTINSLFYDMFELPSGAVKAGDTFEKFLRLLVDRGDFAPADPEAVVRQRLEWALRLDPSQFEHKCRDGRTVEIRRVGLAGGGFITTYIDVTEARRRAAEIEEARARLERQASELTATTERLAAANAAKSLFLANMSHELRTPLNAILGFSEVMRDAVVAPLDSRYRDYARDIHTAGAHLHRLINDILDSSKLDMGRLELDEDEVDLGAVIAECERLLREKSNDAEVSLTIAHPECGCTLQADRLRLKQIILNLLSNAVKFTPPGGRVVLSAISTADRGLSIEVADTGIGMRPEDIPLALQMFHQLDNRFARRYEGSGLGLPLARALTELHGGRLTIQSCPERGTTVRVWLPPERVLARQLEPIASVREP